MPTPGSRLAASARTSRAAGCESTHVAAMANPKHLAKLEAVTAEQVQAVAKKWLTDDNRLVLEYLPASGAAKAKTKK